MIFAEIVPKDKLTCDIPSDCCDKGLDEDDDNETPCDDGGSASGSKNTNEGAI